MSITCMQSFQLVAKKWEKLIRYTFYSTADGQTRQIDGKG